MHLLCAATALRRTSLGAMTCSISGGSALGPRPSPHALLGSLAREKGARADATETSDVSASPPAAVFAITDPRVLDFQPGFARELLAGSPSLLGRQALFRLLDRALTLVRCRDVCLAAVSRWLRTGDDAPGRARGAEYS
jgi:hypothetical protein